MTEAPLSIEIMIEARSWKNALIDLEACVARALNAAAQSVNVPQGAEISVLLTDDIHQKDLNRIWRAQDKPTNVLSFPAAEPDDWQKTPHDTPVLLGDIAVAFETTAREAQSLGKSFADHFCHLLVHGMLHVLGYDHETDAQADEMEPLEITVLGHLGIASPYPDRTARPPDAKASPEKDPMPQ